MNVVALLSVHDPNAGKWVLRASASTGCLRISVNVYVELHFLIIT